MSAFSRMRRFLDSFLGLTHSFKVIIFSDSITAATSGAFHSVYAKMLGATDFQIGLLSSIPNFISLVARIAGGTLALRADKKRMYVIRLFVGSICSLLIFSARDWWWLVAPIILSRTMDIASPAIQTLIGEFTAKATRATAFAARNTLTSIIGTLKSPINGYMADTYGIAPLFLIEAIGGFASCIIIYKFLPRTTFRAEKAEEEGSSQERITVKEALRTILVEKKRNYFGLISISVTWRLFVLGLYPFLEIYYVYNLQWSLTFLGFFYMILGIIRIPIQIPIGKLIDKIGRKPFFVIGTFAATMQWFLYIYLTDPLLLLLLLAITSIYEIGTGLAVSAYWYEAIPLKVYPMGVAIRDSIYLIATVIGGIIGGILWGTTNPQTCFAIMSLDYAIQTIIAALVLKEEK